jgi:hypothetical protein
MSTDHAGCREQLRQQAVALGLDVTVSTARPLVVGSYPPGGFRCPHGTQYWIEPSGEQIAQWHRDGTP